MAAAVALFDQITMKDGMVILVTGSAGHLGEALMRTLPTLRHSEIGVVIKVSPFTHAVDSITDRKFVKHA